MKISRELNIVINWVLNEIIPPALRDSKILMKPLFWVAFGKGMESFWNFHQNVYKMTEKEFIDLNQNAKSYAFERETDLNQACIEAIEKSIHGNKILEVGCGRGYLSKILSKKHEVTAVDIALPDSLKNQSDFKTEECSAESIPFEDDFFDTVICTHTLEHVRGIQRTLSELRRVCKNRIIIVVPCERPYLYTFNLHIHFFPYQFSLLAVTGIRINQQISKAGGDWVYIEDKI